MNTTRTVILTLSALVSTACSAGDMPNEVDATEISEPLRGISYVDARDALSEPEHIDAWYALMSNLKLDFDAICGDTFCEGDYSNYESLGFRCSADPNSGKLGQCVWIFAASTDEIAASTGQVTVHPRSWQCRMPLRRGTTIRAFLSTLGAPGASALHTPLPGSALTLYDGLIDCL